MCGLMRMGMEQKSLAAIEALADGMEGDEAQKEAYLQLTHYYGITSMYVLQQPLSC